MNNIWIIGAGGIAEEYAKVLKSLNKSFIVIGRGNKSAEAFVEHTCVDVITGGLDAFLTTIPRVAEYAIVATPLSELADNTKKLMEFGVKNILCEKPGFQSPDELQSVYDKSIKTGANVYYAYNRRFFTSVLKAQEIIAVDGGVKSFNFEFTEWGHLIEKSGNTEESLRNWFYANSTHVVDLAFYLGGNPIQLDCVTLGELSWHKPAAFAGSGITDKGTIFNYAANWAAPGRWGVELLTSKHRLYLRPMEQLQIQQLGSVAINPVELDDHLDKEFKPGFFLETRAFLNGDFERLCSIEEQYRHLSYYKQILKHE